MQSPLTGTWAKTSAVNRATSPQRDGEIDFITDLREAGYSVLRRIPVEIKRIGPTDYEASFSEANIAMSGTSGQDAYQALVADILDTFDTLSAEQNLGPAAAEQLHILNTYIGRTQGT